MVYKETPDIYNDYFTAQEAHSLGEAGKSNIQNEANLLRVLIRRLFAMLTHEWETLSINDQSKLATLILRAVSTLASLQRAQSTSEDTLAEMLESLQENINE